MQMNNLLLMTRSIFLLLLPYYNALTLKISYKHNILENFEREPHKSKKEIVLRVITCYKGKSGKDKNLEYPNCELCGFP
jgi:hypothetical protein